MKNFDYIARAIIVFILVQTLWFKFRAAPESVAIFSALQVEPWGRYLAGITELVASLLIIYPRTVLFGAAVAFGSMLGAILAHVFVIGIVQNQDSGLLFGMAVFVAVLSVFCIYLRKAEAFAIIGRLRGK